jgi:hypothetical protein
MIKIYKIVDPASSVEWTVGQFSDERHALNEYNSETRRTKSEGINDGRPELKFAERAVEVEFFLTEEEVTHTATKRDEAVETGRWGLVRKST